jgi:SAM-dependent methyltransferase
MEQQRYDDLRTVQLYQAILNELGVRLSPDLAILDFGCGTGAFVQQCRKLGFRAYGVDVKNRWDNAAKVLRQERLVGQDEVVYRAIDADNYKIPFRDDTIDFVLSNQVFEHVQNHSVVLAEIKRVLKPGGISLHIFPSKWRPIECHTFVPLAGVFQGHAYLSVWALLGIRNSYQKELGFREVTSRNASYLKECSNYLSTSEITEIVVPHFDTVRFAEQFYLKHSFGPSRYIYPIVKVLPFLTHLFSFFHTRVLFLKKPKDINVGTPEKWI